MSNILDVAVTWYCLSYIPYAHETIRSFVLHYWSCENSDYWSGENIDY
jgi:hypothetical protein